VGGEWYTGGAGYVGVALFRKELINGFTVNGTNTIPFSQLGVPYDQLTNLQQQAITNRAAAPTATVTVTQQVNADGVLTILGQEVTWVQPLDFLLKGSGFTANYTHVEQNPRGTGAPATAVGVSPWSYNVTVLRRPRRLGASRYVWNDAQVSSGNNQNGIPFADAEHRRPRPVGPVGQLRVQGPADPAARDAGRDQHHQEEPQRSTFAWDNAPSPVPARPPDHLRHPRQVLACAPPRAIAAASSPPAFHAQPSQSRVARRILHGMRRFFMPGPADAPAPPRSSPRRRTSLHRLGQVVAHALDDAKLGARDDGGGVLAALHGDQRVGIAVQHDGRGG
jgi:hypothetical protein